MDLLETAPANKSVIASGAARYASIGYSHLLWMFEVTLLW